MSKSENHWYLAGTTVEVGRAARPRATWRTFAVWLVLIALFVFFYQAYSSPHSAQFLEDWFPWPGLLWVAGVSFAGFLAYALLRQRQLRAAYRRALQEPTPEPLLEVAERSMGFVRAHPDVDALRAHARAHAFTLYGRGGEALRELSAVEWASRAPLVQALGLSAELAQVLLCQGDARRARELARQARSLSDLGAAVPGAAQTARTYETYEALAKALLDVESAEDRALLERAAEDGRFIDMQLLAAHGLIRACERAGDTTRAAQLRGFLQRTAPHCAPLHGPPPASPPVAVEGPVSLALASAAPAADGQGPQARAAQQALRKTGGRLLRLYLVLVALFAFFWLYIKNGG